MEKVLKTFSDYSEVFKEIRDLPDDDLRSMAENYEPYSVPCVCLKGEWANEAYKLGGPFIAGRWAATFLKMRNDDGYKVKFVHIE